jgi:hypothetical protein
VSHQRVRAPIVGIEQTDAVEPDGAKVDRFESEVATLVEATQALRDVLVRYEAANSDLISRVRRGETVLDAFGTMTGPMRRHRELTETLEEFESARHQVRVALFDLALAEGASMAELGRNLGISRQLASRLAASSKSEPTDA